MDRFNLSYRRVAVGLVFALLLIAVLIVALDWREWPRVIGHADYRLVF